MDDSTLQIQPTILITPEQVAFFHENGFLAIDAITTQDEVAQIRGIYDRLFETKAGREEGDQLDLAGTDEENEVQVLPQIMKPYKYAPELLNTLYRANATAIARQLLGAEAEYLGDGAIFKPAGYGAATPWHQDEAFKDPTLLFNEITVWMPLQQATPENGCMQFIPGSHRSEVVEHRSINNDPRIHGLEVVDPVDESQAVACPLPPGGATFHLVRTLHHTAANRSSIPRRAYILSFRTPPSPYPEPRRFLWNELKHTSQQERAAKAAAS